MKKIDDYFGDIFTVSLAQIGWKIFNHQHNKVVASKKTILINTDKHEANVKQDIKNMLTFINEIAFGSYFEFENDKFVLKHGMEEMFKEVAKGVGYYTHGSTLFVIEQTGRVYEAEYKDGKFNSIFDYENARYNLMGSGCMTYQQIDLAALPSGGKPYVNLQGIVTLPRDYNDDDSMLLSEVIICTSEEITVLFHKINLDVDDDYNVWTAIKSCTLFRFALKENTIYTQIYDFPNPPWYDYINKMGDLIKNPFNRDIWEIFDKREMKYEPRYDSDRIFVDYEKNVYVNEPEGWKKFTQEDIGSLNKETLEEYQMYMNIVAVSY